MTLFRQVHINSSNLFMEIDTIMKNILNEKNQNTQPKQLIDPIIYLGEDGTPLTEPVIFYDRPLDFSQPLPDIEPLGPEYYMNWIQIDTSVGHKVMPLDFLNGKDLPKAEEPVELSILNTVPTNTQILELPKKMIDSKINIPADMAVEEDKYSVYDIMHMFLAKKPVIVLNNNLYAYNGTTYEIKMPIEVARDVLKECRELIKDNGPSFVDNVVNYIKREPLVCVDEGNVSTNYVAFDNGVLDINGKILMPHSPDCITLYQVKAKYHSNYNIPTPVFDNYLQTITNGDMLLVERILQTIGYILTPDPNGKCFFLLQGVPDSGKSVFSNFLKELFNDGATKPLEAQLLGDKFTASELIGKVFCTFPDMSAKALDEATVSRIKMFTGGDAISVPVKYGSNIRFVCSAKFIFATNHPFLIKSEDEAFFDRVVTIPFKYAVEKSQKIYNLKEKLLSERDGIVSKAIAAYYRLVDNNYVFAGYYPPNEVIAGSITGEMDYRTPVYSFAKNEFVKNGETVVFMEDALLAFSKLFPGIPENEFYHHFAQFTSELFNAKKGRKRKKPNPNPQSCMCGINFKYNDSNIAEVSNNDIP